MNMEAGKQASDNADALRKSFIERAKSYDQCSGEQQRAAMRTARLIARNPTPWSEPTNERRHKILKHHRDTRDKHADAAAEAYELARRAANVYRSIVSRRSMTSHFLRHASREERIFGYVHHVVAVENRGDPTVPAKKGGL